MNRDADQVLVDKVLIRSISNMVDRSVVESVLFVAALFIWAPCQCLRGRKARTAESVIGAVLVLGLISSWIRAAFKRPELD